MKSFAQTIWLWQTPAAMAKKLATRKAKKEHGQRARPMSLKELAGRLNLSPTSLSLVLNDSPAARTIPQETKDRIVAAAREFGYRPNFLARSLRAKRTYTIGVLVPELSDGYSAMVLGGIEDYLVQQGYFYLVVSHRHNEELLEEYENLLRDRRVEGFIAVDTPSKGDSELPFVAVSGHHDNESVTSVILDHERAATVALEYLVQLGHRQIGFIKGQTFSSDTEVRWSAIVKVASRLNLTIKPSLVAQLEGNSPSPELGYIAAKKIMGAAQPMTALFAFNDVSAIGAIRAFNDAGYRVPEDISVVGFDDVYAAAFQNPPLTTVRQPLWQMGKLAAEILLRRINKTDSTFPGIVTVEPELIIRDSTSPVQAVAGAKWRQRKHA
jgi:LacI family transcriptional regulator